MDDHNHDLDDVNIPPFETEELRKNLSEYLDSDFLNPLTNGLVKVGNFKWGVYAFFDSMTASQFMLDKPMSNLELEFVDT